jgi:hypothetical protein
VCATAWAQLCMLAAAATVLTQLITSKLAYEGFCYRCHPVANNKIMRDRACAIVVYYTHTCKCAFCMPLPSCCIKQNHERQKASRQCDPHRHKLDPKSSERSLKYIPHKSARYGGPNTRASRWRLDPRAPRDPKNISAGQPLNK